MVYENLIIPRLGTFWVQQIMDCMNEANNASNDTHSVNEMYTKGHHGRKSLLSGSE